MDLNEINKQKWKISKKHTVINFFATNIPIEEQECHMNISREDEIIYLDCTHQNYITKLAKSGHFTLLSTTISTKTKDKYVLGVNGTLDINGIIIKKLRKKMTPEQKEASLKRMKENFGK